MGHLSIVNEITFQKILETGFISIRGDVKKLIEKTVADLFSDVLATRENDPIFPWIVKSRSNINLGFKYEFSIGGKAIFVPEDPFPIKIPLNEIYYEYDNPVKEDEALDLFEENLLWNMIGKKSLGRGRSLTHQTPEEDNTLRNKMGKRIQKKLNIIEYPYSIPITINISQIFDRIDDQFRRINPSEKLSKISPRNLQWVTGNRVKYEKVLEAWLMEHFDDSFPLQELIKNHGQLIWLANYLPYGVTGRNIDILAILKNGDQHSVIVIELKKDGLTAQMWGTVVEQVIAYATFLSKAICTKKREGVFPIIIAHSSSEIDDNVRQLIKKWPNEIVIITYSIFNGTAIFSRVL